MTERKKVVFEIPSDARRASCASCGTAFAWVTMKTSGKAMPVELDGERRGESHFAFCPGAGQHRRAR